MPWQPVTCLIYNDQTSEVPIPTNGPARDPQDRLVAPADRLDSWKEIAFYLKRSVRTVTRWESEQGLPVHRHKTGGVYASRQEIDAWWTAHRKEIEKAASPAEGRSGVWRTLVPVAAVALLLMSAAGWLMFRRDTRPAPKLVPLTTYPGIEGPPSLSPDGNQVVFRWNDDIYLKQVDSEDRRQLTNTPGVRENAPAWSPDGRQIAFVRAGKQIFLISPLGTSERWVADTSSPSSFAGVMAWTSDSQSLVLSELSSPQSIVSGLVMIAANTGEKRMLTSPPGPGIGDRMPAISPDGKMVAFTRFLQDNPATIYLMPLAGGEPRLVVKDAGSIFGLTWTPDGRELVFSSDRAGVSRLFRIRADSSGRVSPSPVEGAGEDAQYPSFSRATTGASIRLAYRRDIVDSDIRRAEIVAEGTTAHMLKPSSPFLTSTRSEGQPEYSPDGSRVAFVSNRSGAWEMWTCDRDGSNLARRTSLGSVIGPRWSPDGRQLGFHAGSGFGGTYQMYVMDAAGGAPRRISTDDKQVDCCLSWSQDGRWIYFASARSGQPQLWRMSAGGGEPLQITKGGSLDALVSPHNPELVYYTKVPEVGPGLWSVPAHGGEEIRVLDAPWSGRWALNKKGIYFIDFRAKEGAPKPVRFFSFETRLTKQIGTVEAGVDLRQVAGFAVSPDSRWLLYTKLEREEADLMLVDNFR